jgi:CelD/BcsL family acetyltransferase involved in cellulose biosynthesis
VDELADDWQALCSESVDDQIFYRPEFIRAHILAKAPAAKVVIITVRQEGRLLFLLPLVEETGTFSKIPVRRLREPADLNCGRFDGVLIAGVAGEAAVLAAWRHLREMAGWDLLQLRFSLAGSTAGRLASAAEAEGFLTIHESDRPNPFVPVPTDPAFLENMPRNPKLRSQLRQIRKKIAEQGALELRCVETADPAVLDRIFALEASGWKGRAGTAVNDQPEVRKFLYQLARSAASFGHLGLYMLEFNGELIAAHFSLHYRDRCHSPIVAFNEKFRRLAPGHLIVSEILRDCVGRGVKGFDITGQDQAWKMKWTDQALAITHHYVFKGPIGRLAYGARFGLRSSLRRILPSLGGNLATAF